jgi:hypothetical protein
MAPRKTAGRPGKAARPTQGAIVVDATTSELEKWLAESKRLLSEAEARVEMGEFLPALSSQAALPPLHGTLCERLSELVVAGPEATAEPGNCGVYL